MSTEQEYVVIGSTEYVEIAGIKDIPAKIDTGADTSSIWASQIDMDKDDVLSFVLFDEKSPLYTGEKIKSTDYSVKTIRSSNGAEQIRYRVKLPLVLGDKTFTTSFTLANRSRNNFPVLVGRHTLKHDYLVDVSINNVKRASNPKTPKLNQELQEDPFKFHRKYLKRKGE